MTPGQRNLKPVAACGDRGAAGVRYGGETSVSAGAADGLGSEEDSDISPKASSLSVAELHKHNHLVFGKQSRVARLTAAGHC